MFPGTLRDRVRLVALAGLLGAGLASSGCVVGSESKGVLNRWRAPGAAEFVPGETTQEEVAAQLGPPSQVLALQDKVIFYYLLEQAESEGVILILYNRSTTKVRYDRAIFFFDPEGRLIDYALSAEAAPYEPDEDGE